MKNVYTIKSATACHKSGIPTSNHLQGIKKCVHDDNNETVKNRFIFFIWQFAAKQDHNKSDGTSKITAKRQS